MNRGATENARRLICFGFGFVLSLCSCTTPNPDYPDSFTCNPGDRQCGTPRDRPVTLVCGHDQNDSLALIEEDCPIGTLCDSGTCAPAAGATACQRQADCASGQSCVPLVSNGVLSSFCVMNQSTAMAPGAACTQDSDCQSYHCLEQTEGRFCLLSCSTTNNCQSPTICQTLNVTISGVQGMVGSCSPP